MAEQRAGARRGSPFLAWKRTSLRARGQRLPPGQVLAKGWPVLTYEPEVPAVDRSIWRLRVFGRVERPLELSWEELMALPSSTVEVDVHCVTRWSKLGMRWAGVRVSAVAARAGVLDDASHALAHSVTGYAANLTRDDLDQDASLLAFQVDGEPLAPEHGGPIRLFVPHLYLWKSVKWLAGLEFLDHDRPGYWEQRGYHNRGRPWPEERYST
jgi:DMSO/TMAO reductase YedYZ molybdopterin-dependent catalytic subunit